MIDPRYKRLIDMLIHCVIEDIERELKAAMPETTQKLRAIAAKTIPAQPPRTVASKAPDTAHHTYISDVQLAERYGVTRPTIWRWASQGLLPQPVSLSRGCTRWLKEEIEAIDVQRRRARKQSRMEK